MRGKVKWFSMERGYGFVTDEEARDHYFAVRDVRVQRSVCPFCAETYCSFSLPRWVWVALAILAILFLFGI